MNCNAFPPQLRQRLGRGDDGAAMITVLLLLVALTAVATTVSLVSRNDYISASRDRQATAALATADAGVAQALEYIRQNGVGQLTCREAQAEPPSGTCLTVTTPWGNPLAPKPVRLNGVAGACVVGEACYEVWISAVRPYDPPAVKTGTYRVRSTGFYGGGPGAKAVIVDVDVTPSDFPIGVFGEELVGNGGTRIFNESLFTTDCVSPRYTGSGNGTRFQGLDAFWDIPAAANSTDSISTSNNCGEAGKIHRTSPCVVGSDGVALRYDKDSQGGPLSPGSPCASYTKADGTTGTFTTSQFTEDDLQAKGYRPGGLSDAQFDALKTRAQGTGTYNVSANSLPTLISNAVATGITHPVVYWDNGDVSLRKNDIPVAFARAPGSTCAAPYSVTVIVRHGNLVYSGGTSDWRSLAVFVPEGDFTGNGGYNILGTLFADNLSLGGNENWQLDNCFVDNMPGPLLDLEVLNFREDDRRDIP